MNTKDEFQNVDGTPPFLAPSSSDPLPLTTHARRTHRRLVAIEVVKDFFRERQGRTVIGSDLRYPALRSLEDLINAPPLPNGTKAPGNNYRKMPALMRGTDGTPMHLTRRQYDMLNLWIARLREGTR